MKAMVHNIIKYWRIFAVYKKINFTERMVYRFGFFLMALAVFAQIFFNLFFIRVIFGWAGDIKGWSFYEALLIVGSVMFLDGLVWTTCAFLHALQFHIRRGMLDTILTKPVDSQFLVSIYRGDLEDVVRIVTGTGVIIFSIFNLDLSGFHLLSGIFWYFIMLASAFVIIYSLALMINSVSFWTIEASTFAVTDIVIRAAQYPTDIFSGKFAQYTFSFVFPLAFMATNPAKVMLLGFDWKLVLESLCLALIFFIISRWIWNLGLTRYSSASS